MNCKSYQALTQAEQIEFIGKLVVAVQTRETGFMAAKMMIEAAEKSGVYKRVKVGHEVFEGNHLVEETFSKSFSDLVVTEGVKTPLS